jgi:hypothetical protein
MPVPRSGETILEGHFSPADRETGHFRNVPFQVPAGVKCLQFRFSFSRRIPPDQAGWQDGNILDIGLFDPRGATFLAARGFRGWSGSNREVFFIGAADATPGYLPGAIQPGEWNVVLGLYQIAADGCDYRIAIAMESRDAEHVRRAGEVHESTEFSGAGWLRGDLHAHTWHSDGTASLVDLVAAARAQSLDFVAVTEHNTISHLAGIRELSESGLLLIPGVEISTYRGHANVWPADGFVEFRCDSDEQMRRVRQAVRESGGLFSVNHPKVDGPPWEYTELFEPDCIEVWGGPWFISNYQSLSVWDEQLREGKRITAVGGSDKHVGPYAERSPWYDLGTPCTWVYAEERSVDAILGAVRDGHVLVSATPSGPRVALCAHVAGSVGAEVGIGDELCVPSGDTVSLECSVVGASGSILRLISTGQVLETEIDGDDFDARWEVPVEGDTFWRAEVIEPPEAPLDEEPAALMALALTNPLYVRAV